MIDPAFELGLSSGVPERDGWELVAVHDFGDSIDVEVLAYAERERYVVRFPVPDLAQDQPWLYAEPEHMLDYGSMLRIWLDEEFLAGGAKAVDSTGAIPRMTAERYGLRMADPEEHTDHLEKSKAWEPRDIVW